MGATEAIIKQRLRSGRWVALHTGVYALAGAPPTWHQQVLAAVLACGDRAVASHVASAVLWALPPVRQGPLVVSVPRGCRRRPRGVLVHETRLSRGDVTALGVIPVTTPARTLIDLAASLPPAHLEVALDDALRRELVTVGALARAVERAGPRRRIGVLRALVEARDPDVPTPQSPLETLMARLVREAKIREPIAQYEVTDGQRRAFLDFAWPDVLLAVEVDGYRHHSGRERWESDRARQNMLTLLGWRVLHVTARDLKRRDDVAERIRRALGRDDRRRS